MPGYIVIGSKYSPLSIVLVILSLETVYINKKSMPLIPRVLLNKAVARYATAYWLTDILRRSHWLNQVCLKTTSEWDSDSRGLYNLH